MCSSDLSLMASPSDDDAFQRFCTELCRRYHAGRYRQWVYDVSAADLTSCIQYVWQFRTCVLIPHREDIVDNVQGTAIIVNSSGVRSIFNALMQLFRSGAPRKVFSQEDVTKNPGIIDQWFRSLPL